jgi:hypothetical protein
VNRIILALALLCAGCDGGGGTTPAPLPVPSPVASASPSAAPTPTAKPSAAPTATAAPTTAPTATAVPATHIAAAPAQAFTSTGLQAVARRGIQSVNLGQGGIPTVVGATSPYYGSILTEILAWAENAQNIPVAEASLNAVAANAVSGPVSIASIGLDNSNLFASIYFDWVVQLQINKVGQGSIVATFADGSHGSIPVYIYDQWYLTCPNAGGLPAPSFWAYKNGIPTGIASPPDMSVDCAAYSVTFPNGAIQEAAPVADPWGNLASAFTTVTTGTTNASALTVPVASLQLGAVYIAKLSDGGYAKIMPLVSDGAANSPNISGISLHDNPSGSGQFPF